MRHIAIITHQHDRFEGSRYFLRLLGEYWRDELGIRISVVRGTDQFVPADLAILHLDRTIVPDDYLDFACRYPRVLNLRVRDISKRRISRNLVTRDDGYTGPVIVKTDRNYGGRSEAAARGPGRFARRISAILDPMLPWSRRALLDPFHYPIFNSPADVPVGIWNNRNLIVERLRTEKRGDLYCLRTWLFLGDRETHAMSMGADPIVKMRNVLAREVLGEVPEELRHMRLTLGFDYGKFDYVLHDNQIVLYDVNSTPTLGAAAEASYKPRVPLVANGIEMYFEEMVSK